jgi:hypothetical protein
LSPALVPILAGWIVAARFCRSRLPRSTALADAVRRRGGWPRAMGPKPMQKVRQQPRPSRFVVQSARHARSGSSPPSSGCGPVTQTSLPKPTSLVTANSTSFSTGEAQAPVATHHRGRVFRVRMVFQKRAKPPFVLARNVRIRIMGERKQSRYHHATGSDARAWKCQVSR